MSGVQRMSVVPPEVLRARHTAAGARALMAVCGIVAVLTEHSLTESRVAVVSGFAVILATAVVQLRTPSTDWLKVEESLAPVAAVLIVGLGSERVTIVSLLWLCAVASGVLARGGRVWWVGRAVLLTALLLPIVRLGHVSVVYGAFSVSALALLLTCGRVTQELRAMGAKARYDADHDGLTGALSRTAFRAALERVAEASTPEDGAAVLMLDLSNFGAINKSSGHAAGDQALVSVVPRIQAAIGEDGIVGRLGGDEFAAVLAGVDARAAVRRLLDDLEGGDAQHPALTASVGLAMMPEHGRDAETLLRTVDVALRVAKRMGRHQLSVYAGEPLSAGPGGAAATLRRLIAGDGLEMAVQPIVSIRDGRVHAYEALARFRASTTSSPLYWFELANELSLRDELELACLREALSLLERRPPGTLLSVNLSGSLLLDPRTAALLTGGRERNGLILELTENSLLEDTPGVHAEIARLQRAGIRIAVDDMGAGYSGLRQVTTVRPTYLKLDRSLIGGIDADPDRGALVSALLGYARQTGGHLVAEGVETAAELETLTALGVELIQGYLLGRPAAPWPPAKLDALRASTPPAGRRWSPPARVAAPPDGGARA
jgi:diguanylate cyclase (GGDEF)-like protein